MKYFIVTVFFMSFPIWSQTNFDQGANCYKLEKYEQAKPLFEQFLALHPNDVKSIEYLGDIQCHLNNWEAAIPYYEKLRKLKPTEAEYQYKFGGALAMVAKESNKIKALSLIDDVKVSFQKTLILNPNHIGARWALIEIYLQLPRIFGGSETKAIQYSSELLKISPVDGYLSRGRIEEYFERYASAERQYKKAIEIGNSPTTYQKLADLYKNKMEQPEKARRILAAFNKNNL